MKSIILSEISQSEKDQYYRIYLYVESNAQNKPTNKIETDSENSLTAVKGEWGLSEKVKELRKRKKPHTQRQPYGDSQMERRVLGGRRGQRGDKW